MPRAPAARFTSAVAIGICSVLSVVARGETQTVPDRLASASLEDLMNVEVTSAARVEQRAEDVAAAVYVITQDEIRRSGMTSVPELLRLVPGVQVAQIDGNKWSVAVRGFNSLFSNKLLVLIDGRSIYNRTFSGVFWEDIDLPVEDVDRIEVVRGPGGSVWGANAVNAVINVVTKSSSDTRGARVGLGAGTFDRSQLSTRYGGALGSATYRLSARWSDRAESETVDRRPAGDGWHMLTTGVRVDWSRGADALEVQGGFSGGGGRSLWSDLTSPTPAITPSFGLDTTTNSGFAQGRWAHTLNNQSSLEVRSFYSIWGRQDGGVWNRETVGDVDAQYQTSVGRRHKVSVGGEVRSVDAVFTGTFAVTVTPPQAEAGADSLFVQDIFRLTDRLHLIAGLKVEYDHRVGWNEQPTLRGIWDAGRQHVWAAVSRAVRTPSLLDTGQRLNIAAVPAAGLPVLIAAFGNPDYQPERLLLTEAGYRFEAGSTLVVDATVFHGSYDGLSTNEPLPPAFEATPAPAHVLVATELANLLQASTTGMEVAGHWAPHHAWRFDGSYSALRITPHPDRASHDPAAATFDGNAPAHQWQLHSSTFVAPRVEVNTGLYYTGRLRDLNTDAYLRADARVEWRINKTLSLIGVGQNLLTPLHAEFTDPQSPVLPTLVPRSGRIDLKWVR